MKVWITKYALTKGIFEAEVRLIREGMICNNAYDYWHKPDWHESKAEAHARVREMIAAKRQSIAKTLARLDKIEEGLNDEN